MGLTRADRILRAVESEVWMLQESKLLTIAEILIAKAETGSIPTVADAAALEQRQRGAVKHSGAVAVIPLQGTLSKRIGAMDAMSGGASVDAFAETFREAANNPDVSAILIDVHSAGGSVYGVEEAFRTVLAYRQKKRVVALFNALSASAAYYISVAAGEVRVIPSGEGGSIGVFTVHFDYSEMYAERGIKATIIKAGDRKADANPFQPLSDDAKAHTQSLVDAFYSQFLKAVAKGRHVPIDTVRQQFGQGLTFDSARLLSLGMVDAVATYEETVEDLLKGRGIPGSRNAVTVTTDIVGAARSVSAEQDVNELNEMLAVELQASADRALDLVRSKLTCIADIDGPIDAPPTGVVEAFLAASSTTNTVTATPTAAGGAATDTIEIAPVQPAPEATEDSMSAGGQAAPAAGLSDQDRATAVAQARADEQERMRQIRGIGLAHRIDATQVDTWLAGGTSVADVRERVLSIVEERMKGATVVQVGNDRATQKPFAHLGDQLMAIIGAGRAGGSVDPRLLGIHAAATGAGEQVPSDGGFLLQPEFTGEILKRVYELGQVASRCRKRPIGANKNGLKVNAVDETSRVTGSRYGGIQSYWVGEGDTVTASKPKFRQMELYLKKLMSLFYATDELLEDSTALAAFAEEAFQEEVMFMVENAIFRGTGAGQPLGFLNSSALISVTAESAQAADTVNATNVVKMMARLWARSRLNSAWFINQQVEAQLPLMTIGDQPVYLAPGGLRDNPFGSLLGRPVIPVEYGAAMGDVGDIVLADLSQYLLIDKNSPQMAWSIHVRFLNDEQVLRITYRCDGQPTWNAALTPFLGSATVSPFVALGAR